MAETFSVIASAVQLVGFTAAVTRLVFELGLDWKDAPTSVKNFIKELQSLQMTLTDLQGKLISNPNFEKAFAGESSSLLSHLKDSGSSSDIIRLAFQDAQTQLDAVVKELEQRKSGHRLGWERVKSTFLTKRTLEAVQQIQRQCSILQNLVSIDTATLAALTLVETKELRTEHQLWHHAEENQKILNWLSQNRGTDAEKKHRDVLAKLHPGTGDWILQEPQFRAWVDAQPTESPTLWCPGIPGAGKTVLAAKIVDHLQQTFPRDTVAVLYLYCDYKSRLEQTDQHLVANLVMQSLLQQGDLPHAVRQKYWWTWDGQRNLSKRDYLSLLKSSLEVFERTFIVVDALDEHHSSTEDEHASEKLFVSHLREVQQTIRGQCSILITSRDIDVIRKQLESASRLELIAKDEDIRSYVRYRICNKFRFAKDIERNPSLGDEIVVSLVEKAQGMFLLPRLHLDRLGKQINVRNLRKALNCLPSELNDIYDDTMTRILEQEREYCELAVCVLSWVTKAERRLRVEELQAAVSLADTDTDIDEESLVSVGLIQSVCAGLLAIDEASETFGLVHFTVEEFFENHGSTRLPDAELTIAEGCLIYISFEAFLNMSGGMGDDEEAWPPSIILKSFPLLEYALMHWANYATTSLSNPKIQTLVKSFLGNQRKVIFAWKILRSLGRTIDWALGSFRYRRNPVVDLPATHLLTFMLAPKVLEFWLGNGGNIDDQGGIPLAQTAIKFAVRLGDFGFASFLLSKGPNLRHQELIKQIATWTFSTHYFRLDGPAFRKERHDFVEKLLDYGASIQDHSTKQDRFCIYAAWYTADVDLLRLLLRKGPDTTFQVPNGDSFLHKNYSLKPGTIIDRRQCNSMVVGAGLDMETLDSYGRSPLLRQLLGGRRDAAADMLAMGARASLQALGRQSPVILAVRVRKFELYRGPFDVLSHESARKVVRPTEVGVLRHGVENPLKSSESDDMTSEQYSKIVLDDIERSDLPPGFENVNLRSIILDRATFPSSKTFQERPGEQYLMMQAPHLALATLVRACLRADALIDCSAIWRSDEAPDPIISKWTAPSHWHKLGKIFTALPNKPPPSSATALPSSSPSSPTNSLPRPPSCDGFDKGAEVVLGWNISRRTREAMAAQPRWPLEASRRSEEYAGSWKSFEKLLEKLSDDS